MPTDTKTNPFKPAQPRIPGVPDASPETKPQDSLPKSAPAVPEFPHEPARAPHPRVASPLAPSRSPVLIWIGLAVGIAIIVGAAGVVWWAHKSSAQPASGASTLSDTAAATPDAAKPPQKLPVAPGEIATAGELSKPWSSKRFSFHNRLTAENIDAIAVRLPGGALWGISLREPYGTCELQYVTDLAAILSQYKFPADHPMVVNPCTGAVYDLARYGSGPNGLVRGEIVHGGAVRPPIGIEVVARGNKIVATRIE